MRFIFSFSVVASVVMGVLAGCSDKDLQFTSANLNTTMREFVWGALDGSPEANEEEHSDRELVEPDVIRRSGDLLFILNQYRGLTIVDMAREELLSQTPVNGYPRDLYLVNDQAYVLVSYARNVSVENELIRVTYGSMLYVLDINDPTKITTRGTFGFDGDLVDSRMVGNTLYVVTSDYSWYEYSQDGTSADSETVSYGTTGATAINITTPENIYVADQLLFEGYGNLIYATENAIFTVSHDYGSGNSRIDYVDISDPKGKIMLRGSTIVPGYMADRFKMDAWQGSLRTVTNTWGQNRQTIVTVFDITNPDSLIQLGQTALESAEGDSLFATRFDGPRAYIVTYFNVDPLFIVDLTDPRNPYVAGELEVPGWSTHIETRGDRLIALGVDDSEGRRVMVSLFDVHDPAAPKRLDYVSFGDEWSWSSAYNDVKSLSIFDDILLIPVSGFNKEEDKPYNRLQFVSWQRDRLTVRGRVDVQSEIVRSFAYDNLFYGVTQEELAIIDGSDLSLPVVKNNLVLAENIIDVLLLENGAIVELLAPHGRQETVLRALSHPGGEEAGTFVLKNTELSQAFPWHNSIVLVTKAYGYEPEYSARYEISLVDFSDVFHPVEIRNWVADIEPLWGWGYWGGIYPAEGMFYRPYTNGYYSGNTAFLAGDFLVLHGGRSQSDWWRTRFEHIFAVLDLADPAAPHYLSLGTQNIEQVTAEGHLIYISSYDTLYSANSMQPRCAYFLQSLNPFDRTLGQRINVPGLIIHRVTGTNYAYFKDHQYNKDNTLATVLHSVILSDSRAALVDTVVLESDYQSFMPDEEKLYFVGMPYTVDETLDGDVSTSTTNDTDRDSNLSYHIGKYILTQEGMIELTAQKPVSTEWCTLLGAHANHLYLTVSGTVIAQYDFSGSNPELKALESTMSYPWKISFVDHTAYIPLGYSGVFIMNQ
ncbi:MAG: beta-propeller domain-containing protein [Candidatus Hydrogenedentales bacterium]|jgi:hypothetical protein